MLFRNSSLQCQAPGSASEYAQIKNVPACAALCDRTGLELQSTVAFFACASSLLPATSPDALLATDAGVRRCLPCCRSPKCWYCPLAQKQSRNELSTDYGTKTRRKPKLMFRSSGVRLQRLADRQFSAKSPQLPPRSTRSELFVGPTGLITVPFALQSS